LPVERSQGSKYITKNKPKRLNSVATLKITIIDGLKTANSQCKKGFNYICLRF